MMVMTSMHTKSDREILFKFLLSILHRIFLASELIFLRLVTYLVNWNVSNKQLFCKANNKLLLTLVPHFPFPFVIRGCCLENT